CSSTSVCAVRLLTVAFITNQTPTIGPAVNLKLPIIRLTRLSKTLSISSKLHDPPACKSSTNYVYNFGGKNLMQEWIEQEFSSCDLGDQRLENRLKKILGRISQAPSKSMSSAFRGFAEVVACRRFLDNEAVSQSQLLAP